MKDVDERYIVVSMGGTSSRFQSEGVAIPKWELRLGGVKLFEHAIRSLVSLLDYGYTRMVLVGRTELVGTDLINCCEGLGWNATLVPLFGNTSGQAETVAIGLDVVPDDIPFVVWNIDTIIDSSAFAHIPRALNWLSLAELPGNHWSFARLDGLRVLETAEKLRISDFASVGLYHFASRGLFRDALTGTSKTAGEAYVAPLYNALIARGISVEAHLIDTGHFTAAGTPREVIDACRRHDWSVPNELRAFEGRIGLNT